MQVQSDSFFSKFDFLTLMWVQYFVHRPSSFIIFFSDYGTHTCAGYPGSIDYIVKDAQVKD